MRPAFEAVLQFAKQQHISQTRVNDEADRVLACMLHSYAEARAIIKYEERHLIRFFEVFMRTSGRQQKRGPRPGQTCTFGEGRN